MYKQFENPLVVQKYGGTSVGSVERIHAVAARIQRQYHNGYRRQAIVVSAMAGETNRLVELVQQVNRDARGALADMAVAAGEQVSVALLGAALEGMGIPARPMLGFQLGVFTDASHSRAKIRKINTDRIEEAWREGAVPILAGFQGVTMDLEITTLGRGGSDTSAVALAAALKADFCEINTDVDGVYTADPRFVKTAYLIERVDFNVALEMAALGSKVLHPRCVELAAKFSIPLVVRNSFKDDDSKRTIITMFNEQEALEAPVVSGVSVDKDVARVALKGLSKQSGLISKIFEKIAMERINVDIIVHNRLDDERSMRLGFTISESDLEKAARVIHSFNGASGFDELVIETEPNLAKVSVVGLGMQLHHGVASRAFLALTSENIDIKMISTSEIKISCVVPKSEADRASQCLHDEFCGRG